MKRPKCARSLSIGADIPGDMKLSQDVILLLGKQTISTVINFPHLYSAAAVAHYLKLILINGPTVFEQIVVFQRASVEHVNAAHDGTHVLSYDSTQREREREKKRRCSFSPHECSIYPSPRPPTPPPPSRIPLGILHEDRPPDIFSLCF